MLVAELEAVISDAPKTFEELSTLQEQVVGSESFQRFCEPMIRDLMTTDQSEWKPFVTSIMAFADNPSSEFANPNPHPFFSAEANGEEGWWEVVSLVAKNKLLLREQF